MFRFDTTFTLIKKFFIYKVMGSNLFINYSLGGMKVMYRLFGVKLTNALIENTAGTIFTGGVSLQDLEREMKKAQEERGIGTVAMSVVEGLKDVENSKLDEFLDFSLKSIDTLTQEGTQEGHLALKLTAFVSTDITEKQSQAQEYFAKNILGVSYQQEDNSILSRAELIKNLNEAGIKNNSEAELDQLIENLSNDDGEMTAVHRYAKGHLFPLYGKRSPLMEEIAQKCGGLTSADFTNIDLFEERVRVMTDYASRQNCLLYVDAEQSFIQAAIESYGQQMTHEHN